MVASSGRGAVSEGRRRAEKKRDPGRRLPLLLLVAGALASGVAWIFTAAATIGATVCMLLLFVLGARVLVSLGLVSEYKPRRSSGRRVR